MGTRQQLCLCALPSVCRHGGHVHAEAGRLVIRLLRSVAGEAGSAASTEETLSQVTFSLSHRFKHLFLTTNSVSAE